MDLLQYLKFDWRWRGWWCRSGHLISATAAESVVGAIYLATERACVGKHLAAIATIYHEIRIICSAIGAHPHAFISLLNASAL
jgi:hypothetical protein